MNKNLIITILLPFLGTTLGSACVFIMRNELKVNTRKILAGFAAGVMVAASIWSLLIPAIEQSEKMGKLSFIPAFAGFWIGTLFLLLLDKVVPHTHIDSTDEGPSTTLKKNNKACPCRYLAQYSGGHGSRCGMCRMVKEQRRHQYAWCIGIIHRYRNPEFPGRRNRIHAA